jgi:DNA end-binding protein Ku
VDSDGIEIKPSERKMAEQLIASMTGEFKAEEFEDDYRQALMNVIEAKVAGEEPTPMSKAEPTKIGDLMAALEASVAAAREARRDAAAGATGDDGKVAAKEPRKAAAGKAREAKSSRAKKTAEAEETPTRRRKTA